MSDTTKVAFITGANRGLGLETARILGKQGINVILGARELEKGKPRRKHFAAKAQNPWKQCAST